MPYNYLSRYNSIEVDNAAYWRDISSDQYSDIKPSEQTPWEEGRPYLLADWTTRRTDAPSRAHTGNFIPAFKEYYYNQIYVIPNIVDVGFVLGTHQETIEVWNAYIETSKTLNSITGPTEEEIGAKLEPVGDAPPTLYTPTQSYLYTLTVSPEGPPSVNADYYFNFTGESPTLKLTGIRLVIWGYMPENKWIESFKWKTDVLTSYNGEEQYVKIRPKPRREFSYTYLAKTTVGRGMLFNKLAATIGYNFGVPIWQQLRYPDLPVTTGSYVINIDTSNAEYEIGQGCFLWQSDSQFEACQITDVTATTISVLSPVTHSYDEKAYVTPLVICELPKSIQSNLSPVNATTLSLNFKAKWSQDIAEGNLPAQWGGYDILQDAPEMVSNTLPWSHVGNWETIDYDTGRFNNDYAVQYAKTIRGYAKRFDNKEEIWDFKRWLYKIAGKQGAYYIPDHADKLYLEGIVGPAQTVIEFTATDLALVYDTTPFVKYIQFVFKSGDIYNKEIVAGGVTKVGPVDQVTFTTSFGFSFNMSDITHISILHLVRNTTDTFNFEWQFSGLCTLQFNNIEVLS